MNNKKKRGFTLVEILVVIAIITALASFLFPVLVAARQQGWRINCASNLKQIGQSCIRFAKEHQDSWPSEWWHWGYRNIRNSGRTLGLLYPYYVRDDDLSIFVCPAARNDDKISEFTLVLDWGNPRVDSVTGENLHLFTERTSYPYMRPKVRTWVEKVIMVADEDAIGEDHLIMSLDSDGDQYPPSPNHHYKGANCLWVAGHVGWKDCESAAKGVVFGPGETYLTTFGSAGTPLSKDHAGKSDIGTDWLSGMVWYEDTRSPHDIYLRISPDSAVTASP